jgi:hypothetical protein
MPCGYGNSCQDQGLLRESNEEPLGQLDPNLESCIIMSGLITESASPVTLTEFVVDWLTSPR